MQASLQKPQAQPSAPNTFAELEAQQQYQPNPSQTTAPNTFAELNSIKEAQVRDNMDFYKTTYSTYGNFVKQPRKYIYAPGEPQKKNGFIQDKTDQMEYERIQRIPAGYYASHMNHPSEVYGGSQPMPQPGSDQFKDSKRIFMNNNMLDAYAGCTGYYNAFNAGYGLKNVDLMPEIKRKVIDCLTVKGWTGLRQIKMYFRTMFQGKMDLITHTEFKYNMFNFGVNNLSIGDLHVIFEKFDYEKKNLINFMEFFHSLVDIPEERFKLICQLRDLVTKDGVINLKHLLSIADMKLHPEVVDLKKQPDYAMWEYENTWGEFRNQEGVIDPQAFVAYLCDVSTCIKSDRDFKQLIAALGLRN